MKRLSKAYFQEAKWANDGYVPKFDEYLRVSLITSAYSCLLCAACIGMQDEISKDFFDWVISMPQIIKSINFISRVMNDIASHEVSFKSKCVYQIFYLSNLIHHRITSSSKYMLIIRLKLCLLT